MGKKQERSTRKRNVFVFQKITKRMVVVQLTGGLGNQLFQYAAAKALSLHHQVSMKLDTGSFYRSEIPELEVPRNFELNNFTGITDEIINAEELNKLFDLNKPKKIFHKIFPAYKKHVYIEPHFHYDKNFFHSKKNVLLIGKWQSEKYFFAYRKEIRNILQLDDRLVTNVISTAKELEIKESVAIHVRRGDYLRKKIIFDWHGVMEKDYYIKALEIISKSVNPERILFFTDDPQWVEKELLSSVKGEIASGRLTSTHFEDLYLMSRCKHNIIANSSFSWWSAWLNNNPGKIVVAPAKWFGNGPKDTQDIIPPEWHKI